MSAYWGHAAGVITGLLLIAFLGIWVWAWRPRHKDVFDRMARVPLDDDEAPPDSERVDDGKGDADEQRGEGRKR